MAVQHAQENGGEEAIPVQPASAADVEGGKAEFEGRRQGSYGEGEDAQRQINTQGSTLDSHGGAVLPRNWDTAGNSNIHMTKGDVVLIQPLGENMVRMYLSDGSFVDTARVITGMGQDTTAMRETLPGKPQDLKSLASPDGEQFGLQTPGGEFRYLGAAA